MTIGTSDGKQYEDWTSFHMDQFPITRVAETPIPKADPRGNSFNERIPGDTEESGAYVNAEKFMQKKDQNTKDLVIDPNTIMNNNSNIPNVWGDVPEKRADSGEFKIAMNSEGMRMSKNIEDTRDPNTLNVQEPTNWGDSFSVKEGGPPLGVDPELWTNYKAAGPFTKDRLRPEIIQDLEENKANPEFLNQLKEEHIKFQTEMNKPVKIEVWNQKLNKWEPRDLKQFPESGEKWRIPNSISK